MEVKEEEYRKLKSKVDNLFEAISDEEDKIVRKSLTGKLKELQEELEKLELAISNFKAEQNTAFSGIGGGNVVDLSSVFMLLKSFKTGFEKADVSLQSEILRDLIHQIIVQENGIKVKLYAVSGGFSSRKNQSNGVASCRTAVRSAFKLVEIIGIEPTTSCMPCKRSPS